MSKAEWFAVDKDGLAKQLANVPRWRLIAELIQNAWDEQSTRVSVSLDAVGAGWYGVHVLDDNPDGFKDLTHAWTLFAPSEKAGNPEQRGRFNLGEKLILAAARVGEISTTTGTVIFDTRGRRRSQRKTAEGSTVYVVVKIGDKAAYDAVVTALGLLIPPKPTYLNGTAIPKRDPLKSFTATLPTLGINDAGEAIRTERQTEVTAYLTDESWIYEMGIPVVKTDFPWSLDVQQKVPLNRDRDNVTPRFLRTLQVAAFNYLHDEMRPTEFRQDWAREAAGDPTALPEAVTHSLDARFTKNRVAFDVSDPEANRLAAARGMVVVHGGSLSAGEWENARPTTLPAGKVTPSPKPYTENGDPLQFIDNLSPAMVRFSAMAHDIHNSIPMLHYPAGMSVRFTRDASWPFQATFGPSRQLVVNVAKITHMLGDWARCRSDVIDLLIHEFGHFDASNHLEERYWHNLTAIGSEVVELALKQPELFK